MGDKPTLLPVRLASTSVASPRNTVLSWRALIYAALAAMALIPIFSVEILPLVDYPNHLARMHVLTGFDGSTDLRANYAVEWRAVPNLAMDVIVPLMTAVMPLSEAARVFTALGLVLVAAGIAALHRAVHGPLGLWPGASVLALYNLPLAWGFLNFYFSIGTFLLVFAGWIAIRNMRTGLRLALFNTAASGVYFSHMFGFAALVLTIAIYEAWLMARHSEWNIEPLLRRVARLIASFAAPILIHIAALLGVLHRVEPLELGTWWGNLLSKSTSIMSAFLFYGGLPDLLLVALVAIVAVATIGGAFALAPQLRWPLIGLAALTLVAPQVLGGIFLDGRIGVVLGCVAIAALRPIVAHRAVAIALYAALFAVFALKVADIRQLWQARELEYVEFRSALKSIRRGASVLSAHDSPDRSGIPSYSVRWLMAVPALEPGRLPAPLAYRNLECLAVIERDAFAPSLFKHPSAQPIQSSSATRHIDPIQPARRVTTALLVAGANEVSSATVKTEAARRGERAFWADWPRNFDYLIIFRYAGLPRHNPAAQHLLLVSSGSFFDIYEIRR